MPAAFASPPTCQSGPSPSSAASARSAAKASAFTTASSPSTAKAWPLLDVADPRASPGSADSTKPTP
ncbi:MAG: hypothetical protein MUF34_29675 [Polyangiaceae bacterium]|nr:hypothetical protein [Polyangiaceae bacterium]